MIGDHATEVLECPICNEYEFFDAASLFEDHMSSVHQIDLQNLTAYWKFESGGHITEVIECPICDAYEFFHTVSHFEDHMSSAHQIDTEKMNAYRKFDSNKTIIEEGKGTFLIKYVYLQAKHEKMFERTRSVECQE